MCPQPEDSTAVSKAREALAEVHPQKLLKAPHLFTFHLRGTSNVAVFVHHQAEDAPFELRREFLLNDGGGVVVTAADEKAHGPVRGEVPGLNNFAGLRGLVVRGQIVFFAGGIRVVNGDALEFVGRFSFDLDRGWADERGSA
jgi:hypothetical protein